MASFPAAPRKLRLCYWNIEAQLLDSSRIELEKKLHFLEDLSVQTVSGLRDPALLPCDLLVVAAHKVPSPQFSKWLDSLRDKIHAQVGITIPVLIMAATSFELLQEVFAKAVQMNWYFDIIDPNHLSSLPLRVANLLRVHDHLHEMARYHAALEELRVKMDRVVAEVAEFKK